MSCEGTVAPDIVVDAIELAPGGIAACAQVNAEGELVDEELAHLTGFVNPSSAEILVLEVEIQLPSA